MFLSRVITITGAAAGIGLATAKLIASRGALISIADINLSNLEAAPQAIRSSAGSVKIFSTHLDTRKPLSVDEWISSTVWELGPLYGAANLAGILGKHAGARGIGDLEEEDWNHVMDVNLKGLMYFLRAQMRVMKDGGAIVTASSVAVLQGFANNAPYVASKHGVIGLTKSAAKEVADRGIKVNVIAPGTINTPMVRKFEESGDDMKPAGIPLGREGNPEEVAELIAWLLVTLHHTLLGRYRWWMAEC